MNFFPRLVLASVLPVILAAAAHATTIFTPPVIPDDDGTFDGGKSSIRASVEVLSSSSMIEAVYPVP